MSLADQLRDGIAGAMNTAPTPQVHAGTNPSDPNRIALLKLRAVVTAGFTGPAAIDLADRLTGNTETEINAHLPTLNELARSTGNTAVAELRPGTPADQLREMLGIA